MTSWTLRQQRTYSPHGNGPQTHSAARRAVRQIRRHASETQTIRMEDEAWAAEIFREHRAWVLSMLREGTADQ